MMPGNAGQDPTVQSFICERLLERASHGDQEACDQLLAIFRPVLYRYAKSKSGSADHAEDVVQDACLNIFSGLLKGLFMPENPADPTFSFYKWCLRITHHCYINLLRKEKSLQSRSIDQMGEDCGFEPEDRSAQFEERILLKESLSTLAFCRRLILELHLLYGYTFQEIAQILHRPLGTIYAQYNKALQIIRESLGVPNPPKHAK